MEIKSIEITIEKPITKEIERTNENDEQREPKQLTIKFM